MARTVLYLLCLIAPALGATPTWESLRLPATPTPRDVAVYLKTVRGLANGKPPESIHKTPPRRAPVLEPALVAKTRAALDAVLPQWLGPVLEECKASETAWANERPEVYIQMPNGRKEFVGYQSANLDYRTPFTRIALDRIAALPDITPAQHRLLFERVGDFPELILGLAGRPWLNEIDPYLSPKLMRQIDHNGWWGTSKFWIEALLKIDSVRSWQALESLLIESRELRMEVYTAIQDGPYSKIDVDAAVARAWKAHTSEVTSVNRAVFAAIAARHGVTRALVELAEYVEKFWETAPPPKASAALLSLVEGQFADAKQAAVFVAKNARRLNFNRVTRRYSVSDLP